MKTLGSPDRYAHSRRLALTTEQDLWGWGLEVRAESSAAKKTKGSS